MPAQAAPEVDVLYDYATGDYADDPAIQADLDAMLSSIVIPQ